MKLDLQPQSANVLPLRMKLSRIISFFSPLWRRLSDKWRGWKPVVTNDSPLRREIEPFVDNFHKGFPLLARVRDSALIHLLRYFEDSSRLGMMAALSQGKELGSYLSMRHAQEGLPWAMRWVWEECPQVSGADLDIDWSVYEEAAKLFHYSHTYYQLFRCFVLYSRGYFSASMDRSVKRIRFLYANDSTMRRDITRQFRDVNKVSSEIPSQVLQAFLDSRLPFIHSELPKCLVKTGDHSIRYHLPPEISHFFRRWASLYARQMRFDLPGVWAFGGYNLGEFRSFWKSLLTLALCHSFAHHFADGAVGTTGVAVGSVVMQMSEAELTNLSSVFPVSRAAARSIIEDLTYSPQANYWDPIWQPLFRLTDGSFLISPSLIMGSSPERNLITFLNRNPQKTQFYTRVSSQKEDAQLTELEGLFVPDRFVTRRRVPVHRPDGSQLSDIDLLVFDRQEGSALLLQAKWLIWPDYVTEVLSADDQLLRAIEVARNTQVRVEQLGGHWLSEVLEIDLPGASNILKVLIVNRDFLPSGWVADDLVPVVDMAFLREFTQSDDFQGLESLHAAASGLDESLGSQYRLKTSYQKIVAGKYFFELPIFEPENKE